MTALRIVPSSKLAAWVGFETGVSEWILVDQARIDGFADVTGDHQFIHVDPEAAKATPFGGTIAHGLLTLSLLAPMTMQATLALEGAAMGLNYGFDKVRFLEAVPSGARVRGRFMLTDAREKGSSGRWLLTYEATVEIEGKTKPALIATFLVLQIVPK